MKLAFLLLLFVPTSIIISQEGYKGFAISGNGSIFSSINSSSNYSRIRSNLDFNYFLNQNQYVKLTPIIEYENGSNQISDPNFYLSLGYGYIHWIHDRIGIESSISLNRIATDDFTANLSLGLAARVTQNLDINFRLASTRLYGKSNFTTSNDPIFNVTRSETTILSLPNNLFSNISVRYRIPNSTFSSEKTEYAPSKRPDFGISLNASHSDNTRTVIDEFGGSNTTNTKNLNIGIGFVLDPFSKVAYGGNIEYRRLESNSFKNETLTISPEIRRNWLYSDGFGMFTKGGPTVGVQLNDLSNMVFGIQAQAGFTYIIKETIMLDFSFSSLSTSYSSNSGFNQFNINFAPLRTPRIGITVAI